MEILGLPIPDAGPVFLAALVIHVAAGLTCVTCGATAALTRKGGVVHRWFGRIYLWALCVLFASLTVLSIIRWRENAHLFVIGAIAFTAVMTGYLNRRRRPQLHVIGMGLSYIALLTGFYVDNGPNLPVWDRLPHWSFWVLPSLIGIPLIARALRGHRAASATGPHPSRARRA